MSTTVTTRAFNPGSQPQRVPVRPKPAGVTPRWSSIPPRLCSLFTFHFSLFHFVTLSTVFRRLSAASSDSNHIGP